MKLTGGNQSVEKTLYIIEALARSSRPMRLSELSKAVDMPSSTVLRMVSTLVDMGYAFQEENDLKRYGLTMRFLYMGQMAAEHISFRDVAHDYLMRLSDELGESGCLSIEDNHRVRYLDVTEGRGNLITIRQRVGGSGSMHCTGSGKLFLTQYTDKQLDDYVANVGLQPLTVHTVTNKKELVYELESCKAKGYAVDDEECEIGMRCVAAPIYDINGKIIAVISISGPVSRMPRLRYETEIAPKICESAARITQVISGKLSVESDVKSTAPVQ